MEQFRRGRHEQPAPDKAISVAPMPPLAPRRAGPHKGGRRAGSRSLLLHVLGLHATVSRKANRRATSIGVWAVSFDAPSLLVTSAVNLSSRSPAGPSTAATRPRLNRSFDGPSDAIRLPLVPGHDICRSPVVPAGQQVEHRRQPKDQAHRAAEDLTDDARAIAGCVRRSCRHAMQPYPSTGQQQLDDDDPDDGSFALRHCRSPYATRSTSRKRAVCPAPQRLPATGIESARS